MDKKTLILKNKLLTIEKYYLRAWRLFMNNENNEAIKLIHNRLPVELYDFALDMLEIKMINGDPKVIILYNEVQCLVGKVEEKLTELSNSRYVDMEELDVDKELQSDNFNKSSGFE